MIALVRLDSRVHFLRAIEFLHALVFGPVGRHARRVPSRAPLGVVDWPGEVRAGVLRSRDPERAAALRGFPRCW